MDIYRLGSEVAIVANELIFTASIHRHICFLPKDLCFFQKLFPMFAKYSLNSSILSVRSSKECLSVLLFLLVLFLSLLSRARLCCLFSLVVFFVKDDLVLSINTDTLFYVLYILLKVKYCCDLFSSFFFRMIFHF